MVCPEQSNTTYTTSLPIPAVPEGEEASQAPMTIPLWYFGISMSASTREPPSLMQSEVLLPYILSEGFLSDEPFLITVSQETSEPV